MNVVKLILATYQRKVRKRTRNIYQMIGWETDLGRINGGKSLEVLPKSLCRLPEALLMNSRLAKGAFKTRLRLKQLKALIFRFARIHGKTLPMAAPKRFGQQAVDIISQG